MAKEKKSLTPAEELNEKLDKMETAGMKKTKTWASMWQTSLRYFFSEQLENKKTHKDWDWVIVNWIWPSAIQEIAKLSKNNPRIICNPWEDSDADFAEAWQSILQWLWEKGLTKHGMRLEQIAAILDGKLFGYRICKIYWEDKVRWDDKEKEWVGDVRYRLWHPAEFWASDAEKINDGDCGTVRYVTLDYALHRWPQHKKALTEEASKFKREAWGGDHIRGQLGTAGTYPATGSGGIDKGVGTSRPNELLNVILSADKTSTQIPDDDTKFVKISETYFRDYIEVPKKTEEPIPPQELIDTGQIVNMDGNFYSIKTQKPLAPDKWPTRIVKEWKEPKYPNGRYVIRAGHTILNPKEEDQKYSYSGWPFITSPHYLLPHMWQGVDSVQLYKSTQDMINVTVSHLVNNMKMFGDPKIAVEAGAIDSPPGRKKSHYRIGAAAGAVIRLVRGGLNRFKVIDPPAASASATQLYALFTQELKNLMGLHSLGRGEKEKGRMTATQSYYLALSANDRIALQAAYEDEWVKQVVTLAAEICQQNYSEGRLVRIVGENGIVGAQQITKREKEVRFDVDVESGATLPFDEEKRIQKYMMAYQILQNPVANALTPDILRILEIRNWKKILAKYEGWQRFVKFVQLFEAVKAGKVSPQQAVQMLTQAAMAEFSGQQKTIEGVAARNVEKEKFDAEYEKRRKQEKAEQKAKQTEKAKK